MSVRSFRKALERALRCPVHLLCEVADSDEIRDGVVVDYDASGEVLGIELLSASRRTDNPAELVVTLSVQA